MPKKPKEREPSVRILIDLPIMVATEIEMECIRRKQAGKPINTRKTYIEMLCTAHVNQQLKK